MGKVGCDIWEKWVRWVKYLKATLFTLPLCPRKLPKCSHVYVAYIWIVFPLTAAKHWPPWAKRHSGELLMESSLKHRN